MISNNIDTSEMKYEKVFPASFDDTLQDDLVRLDSSFKKQKRVIKDGDVNNVAVVYLYENDSLVKHENEIFGGNKYFSAFCNAMFLDDTLTLTLRITSFNKQDKNAVVIRIVGNYYTSNYYLHTDSSGTDDTKEIIAIKQILTLKTRPILERGKFLLGKFEGIFEPYYRNNDSTHPVTLRIRAVFRCVEKQVSRI